MLDLKNKHRQLLILGTLSFVALWIKPIALVLMLVFPGLLLVRVQKKNLWLTSPLILATNILLVIVNAVVVDTFNLPVSFYAVFLMSMLLTALVYFFKVPQLHLEKDMVVSKYIFIIYGLFLLAIISRVVSVWEFEVPILHDPQAHAYWATRIINERSIDYFYSPGLHIWSMLTTQALGITTAKSVLLLTNIFSAFGVITWSIMTYVFTKNIRIAMWSAIVLLIVPLPQFLYFMAGKNSYVMSSTFIPLALIFGLLYFKNKSFLTFSGLVLGLVGVGLIHYPAFALAVGAVILFLLLSYVSKIISSKDFLFRRNVKNLVLLFAPIVIALLAIGINTVITKAEDSHPNLVSSRAEAKAYHETAESTGYIPPYQVVTEEKSTNPALDIKHPKNSFVEFKNDFFAFYKSLPEFSGYILLGTFIVGFYFLLSQIQYTDYRLLLLSLLTSIFLIVFLLFTVRISSLSTTRDTGFLLSPIAGAMPLAWLLATISKRKWLEIIAISFVGVAAAISTYGIYQAKSKNTFVNQYDKEAYEWINANIDDSEGFVSVSSIDPNRASIIFPVDGALWLPVITDNKIATPFQELGFQRIESHVNYEYTRSLRSEIVNLDAVKHFIENGYTYVYVDGDAASDYLGIDILSQQQLIEQVYSNEEVSIHRFLSN